LQELIAPRKVVFYANDFSTTGTKSSLAEILSEVTGIDEDILDRSMVPMNVSIAGRMSWASRRHNTRPEDIAYSLLGLFDVKKGLLYGEGENAFSRLQPELMKSLDEQSLFAWQPLEKAVRRGVLARLPKEFEESGDTKPMPYLNMGPYVAISKGISMQRTFLRSRSAGPPYFIGLLGCMTGERNVIGIPLASPRGTLETDERLERVADVELSEHDWHDIDEEPLFTKSVYLTPNLRSSGQLKLLVTTDYTYSFHICAASFDDSANYELHAFYPNCRHIFETMWFAPVRENSPRLAVRFEDKNDKSMVILIGSGYRDDGSPDVNAVWCSFDTTHQSSDVEAIWEKWREHSPSTGRTTAETSSSSRNEWISSSQKSKRGLTKKLWLGLPYHEVEIESNGPKPGPIDDPISVGGSICLPYEI
jgi:hypothetical protein